MADKPISIKNLIEDYMYTMQEDDNRDSSSFHPSSVGKCCRQIVYSMLGYPAPKNEPRLMRIFECGHSMHERYQRWFEGMGIQIAAEIVLNADSDDELVAERCRELNISGRTDSLLLVNGRLCLVELKSANSNMFKFHLKEPKEEHVLQLQLYMYLTNIMDGILLYEDKNTQEIKEFYIKYNPEIVDELLEKIRYVNECIRNRELPERESAPPAWQCRYCSYVPICHYPDSDEGKELLAEYARRDVITRYNQSVDE